MEAERPGPRVALWIGAALLLAIAATWPLTRHIGSALPRDLGDPLLNAWIIGWDADRLRHGFAGLWDAPILYPSVRTLAFSEHLLGLAIPVAPVVWLTENSILAHNVAFLLTYVLAASGMFLLARFVTTRSDAAGVAALAFAFAPARVDQLAHIQVLASGWMPLSLWALHRYFATFSRRALAVFALAFVWQAYSNGYFLYFLSIAAGIVALFEIAWRWNTITRRLTATLLEMLAASAAILLALAPIATAYVDVRRTYGFRRSLRDLTTFSAAVESYLHVAEPVKLWGRWLATELAPERQLFPGLTTIVLAALGVAVGRAHGPSQLEGRMRVHVYAWCYATIAAAGFVLSLGPAPTGWGLRVLPFSPYLFLASILPGFDGLRAPARFSALVLMGFSVLSAMGAAWCIDAARKRGSTAGRPAAFVLGGLILLEGWAAPIPIATFDPRGRADERPLYDWLAASAPGAVLELPIKRFDVAPTLTYQYATLRHRHPIVNGYSGYGSALQAWLGGPTTPLNELTRMDAAVDMLQSLGVRYVIVHLGDYDNPVFARQTVDNLESLGSQVSEARTFGATHAFRLSDNRKFSEAGYPADQSRRLSSGAFTADASHAVTRLHEAFDGNTDSRWMTGRGQRGDEWIRIDFAEKTRVAGLRLTMSYGTLGEYPRGLTVEGRDDSGSTVTLRSGPVLASLADGLLKDTAYPVIAVPLPSAPAVSTLLLRQTGLTGNLNWSIHELEILAR